MKKLLFIVFLMLTIQLEAQVRIGNEEAFSTAEQFVSQQGKQDKPTLTLSEEIKSVQSGETNLFVFSMQPQGFIIVSALNEVLAYSLNSTLPISAELPDHITYWLDLYNQQTDYLIEHPERHREPTKSQQSVGPLLTSIWGQGCYHNASCPRDSLGPCQHVSAGCVAIAMAQIMYYHKQPLIGNGSKSYFCPPYGVLSADFGQTTYRWDEMADTLHEDNSAVAELVYHCGVSVKTHYSAQSSWANSSDAVDAFCQFFHYPNSTSFRRKDYIDEKWLTMMMDILNVQHPIYYVGGSSLGRHAFICDGYDSNGMFHFNFGWDGAADGYYTLNDPSGLSNSQSIIDVIPTINMKEEICKGQTFTFFGRYLNKTGNYSSFHNHNNYELTLIVDSLPMIQCSNDTVIKFGSSVQLNASGADSYLWSTGDTTQCITVYPISDKNYTVQGFSKNGCSNVASVTVRVVYETDETTLFPNPANDKVEIYMPLIDEVEVFNFLGVKIDDVKAERKVVELDVSNYPSGVYVVHVRQLSKHYYKKLVIQH